MDKQTALAAVVSCMHKAFALGKEHARAAESWDTALLYCDTDAERAAHAARCAAKLVGWARG